MKEITTAQLKALTTLQRQVAYVSALTEHVLLGGTTNRHESMARLPAALKTLSTRLDAARVALALDYEVP